MMRKDFTCERKLPRPHVAQPRVGRNGPVSQQRFKVGEAIRPNLNTGVVHGPAAPKIS